MILALSMWKSLLVYLDQYINHVTYRIRLTAGLVFSWANKTVVTRSRIRLSEHQRSSPFLWVLCFSVVSFYVVFLYCYLLHFCLFMIMALSDYLRLSLNVLLVSIGNPRVTPLLSESAELWRLLLVSFASRFSMENYGLSNMKPYFMINKLKLDN